MKPRGGSTTMAHVNPDRDDVNFFPTQPWGGRAGAQVLLEHIDPLARSVWEPACGSGTLAHGLRDYFPTVHVSDAYRYGGHALFDFVAGGEPPFTADWIITNPPFDYCDDFIRLAYARARRGVAMLMRINLLEGIGRFELMYRSPGIYAHAPFVERLPIVQGRYDPEQSSAAFYSWFYWLKPGGGPRRRPPHPYCIAIPPGTRAALERDSDLAFAVRAA